MTAEVAGKSSITSGGHSPYRGQVAASLALFGQSAEELDQSAGCGRVLRQGQRVIEDLVAIVKVSAMMPPKNPRPPATGDIAPYPSEGLHLGDGRYMYANGRIVAKLRGARPVEIKENTRKFWEEVALKVHGKPLSELMA